MSAGLDIVSSQSLISLILNSDQGWDLLLLLCAGKSNTQMQLSKLWLEQQSLPGLAYGSFRLRDTYFKQTQNINRRRKWSHNCQVKLHLASGIIVNTPSVHRKQLYPDYFPVVLGRFHLCSQHLCRKLWPFSFYKSLVICTNINHLLRKLRDRTLTLHSVKKQTLTAFTMVSLIYRWR